MAVLTSEDLKQIKQIVDTSFTENFGAVWENNLEPAFEALHATMATKDDIANMATKDDIANMATKDDMVGVNRNLHNVADVLDAKITNYMDSSGRRDEALLKRQDLAVRKLEEKQVFTKQDTREINLIPVFKPSS